MSMDNVDSSINTHAPSVVQIESSKLLPWLAICAILSSLALGITIASVIADSKVESAREQTINDIRNRAIDAEVEAKLLREHYDKINNDFAVRGIRLPALPRELQSAK